MPLAGMDWLPAIWIGGGLFVVSVLLAGYLTPDYSHIHQSISELGERNAPHAWLVRWLGFVPLGLSFVLFARQSGDLFTNNIPFVIFLLMGIAVIIAGIFPTDPDNRRETISGKVHAIAVISLLFLLSLSPFIFSIPALYRNPLGRCFSVFSFLMGVLILGFLTALPNGSFPQLIIFHRKLFGGFIETRYHIQGLHQRLLLALFGIWWFIFSVIL
jgi:hypothetical membrane protein